MWSLVRKDILIIVKSLSPIYFVVLVAPLMPMLQMPKFALPIGSLIIFFFLSMLVTSTLAADEAANWYQYAVSLPVSKYKLIASKYLLLLIAMAISAVLVLLLALLLKFLFNIEQLLWFYIIYASCLSGLYTSVLIPVTLKFGFAKSRIVSMSIFIIPIFLITFLGKYNLNALAFLPQNIYVITLILVLATGLLFFLSLLLSARILKRKDF